MEWALDTRNTEAVGALRREVIAYLGRHATPDSDLPGAEIVVAELLANAFEHAPGPSWVRTSWAGPRPRLEVHDLGPGFELPRAAPEPLATRGRGLFLVNAIAEELGLAAKAAGGSKVTTTLPVRRRVEASHDPPRRALAALPGPDEASEDGSFGRESFLRALVVELAQTVEVEQGPDVTAATVAQVGGNVGARMEEAYRAARGLTGRLTPTEMADLYVRLKRAIDGDFYLVSVDSRKIVLGNRRCPFGSAVRHEPGLCRMTSSVFGGIAARNAGRSSVVLEERIALGDPECRVVVWLGANEPDDPDAAHLYMGPADMEEYEPDGDLVEACRAAMRGEEFLYPEAVVAFMRHFVRHGEYVRRDPDDPLTPREHEVVALIADSYTGKEIAGKLMISEKTVEHHRGNILLKLGLRDRVALTRYAIRHGLIEA